MTGPVDISPGAIEFTRVPVALTRRLGRYEVPVFRLARLAVGLSAQGLGIGGDLLPASTIAGAIAAAERKRK